MCNFNINWFCRYFCNKPELTIDEIHDMRIKTLPFTWKLNKKT